VGVSKNIALKIIIFSESNQLRFFVKKMPKKGKKVRFLAKKRHFFVKILMKKTERI